MEFTDGRRNSGINKGAIKAFFAQKRMRRLLGIAAAVLAVAFAVAVLLVLREQEDMLARQEAERARLEEQLHSLERQLELIEYKTQYVKTNEGLKQYAMDELGAVNPGDKIVDPGD